MMTQQVWGRAWESPFLTVLLTGAHTLGTTSLSHCSSPWAVSLPLYFFITSPEFSLQSWKWGFSHLVYATASETQRAIECISRHFSVMSHMARDRHPETGFCQKPASWAIYWQPLPPSAGHPCLYVSGPRAILYFRGICRQQRPLLRMNQHTVKNDVWKLFSNR